MTLAVHVPRARILIADDDAPFRSLLSHRLRRAGHAVTESHDGRELLDTLLAAKPGFFDLVISDHRMPGLFGLECLALAGSRAPFVIVSAFDDANFHASARRFGASRVVSKQIDLDDLLAIVAGLLPRAVGQPLPHGAPIEPRHACH